MAPGSDAGKDSSDREDEAERAEEPRVEKPEEPVATAPGPNASRRDAREEDGDSERRGGGENRGTTLFVSNIAGGSVERDLENIFAEIGKVRKCTVIYDPRSGQSRGFAFVEMEGAEEADQCVYELNKKVKLDGNTLLVEKARRSGPRNPTPGSYMGVRNPRRETGMRDHPYGRGPPPPPPRGLPPPSGYGGYRRPAYDSYGHAPPPPPPPQMGPPAPHGYEPYGPYAPRYGGPPEYDRDARGRSPPRERDRERITLPAHYRSYTAYPSVYPPSEPPPPPADTYAPPPDLDRRARDREYSVWDRRRRS